LNNCDLERNGNIPVLTLPLSRQRKSTPLRSVFSEYVIAVSLYFVAYVLNAEQDRNYVNLIVHLRVRALATTGFMLTNHALRIFHRCNIHYSNHQRKIMKQTLLISTISMSIGLGMAFSAQAADPIGGAKPQTMKVDGISKASKDGGEKGGKGGKDKMGSTMMKDGGDKGGKGGKDKMGSTMMKEGGEKGPKGGKDKLGGAALKGGADMGGMSGSKQMGGAQGAREAMGR